VVYWRRWRNEGRAGSCRRGDWGHLLVWLPGSITCLLEPPWISDQSDSNPRWPTETTWRV